MSDEVGTFSATKVAGGKLAGGKLGGGKLGGAKKAGIRKKRKYESYNAYTYRVLKQVHKDLGVSKKSMDILDNFVVDIFEKIATEAGKLVKMRKTDTLKLREIQTATQLVLPGDLAKHACVQGRKAVQKYDAVKNGDH